MAELGFVDIAIGGSSAYFIATYLPTHGPRFVRWAERKLKEAWKKSMENVSERIRRRRALKEPDKWKHNYYVCNCAECIEKYWEAIR